MFYLKRGILLVNGRERMSAALVAQQQGMALGRVPAPGSFLEDFDQAAIRVLGMPG